MPQTLQLLVTQANSICIQEVLPEYEFRAYGKQGLLRIIYRGWVGRHQGRVNLHTGAKSDIFYSVPKSKTHEMYKCP